jgi:putative tryptophan/tyrosine transport system ATP-binding protein
MCIEKALLSFEKVSLNVPFKESSIFKNLSLDIHAGEFVMLLGGNGSGKSSLIKMINGLAVPSSGSVVFEDRDLLKLSISNRSKKIITLTQDLNLSTFSALTILENCMIALMRTTPFCFPSSFRGEMEVKEYLASYNVNLCDKLHLPVSSLSGGERQTLALALSIWNLPKLLLLDEHTSALDPHIAKKMMDLTERVIQEKGITTLVVTHSLSDALRYGSRLIVLKQGEVALDVKEEEKKALTQEALLKLY